MRELNLNLEELVRDKDAQPQATIFKYIGKRITEVTPEDKAELLKPKLKKVGKHKHKPKQTKTETQKRPVTKFKRLSLKNKRRDSIC